MSAGSDVLTHATWSQTSSTRVPGTDVQLRWYRSCGLKLNSRLHLSASQASKGDVFWPRATIVKGKKQWAEPKTCPLQLGTGIDSLTKRKNTRRHILANSFDFAISLWQSLLGGYGIASTWLRKP